MVTIDLNTSRELDEILRQIASGESVRLVRGDDLVAIVTPRAALDAALWDSCNWDDKAWLAAATKATAKSWAKAFGEEDFSSWGPPDATR